MKNTSTIDKVSPIKQFKCTSCGASLEVINKRAKYTGCSYCGSLLDVQSDTYKVLSKIGTPTKHQPFTFVRIGMKATFKGQKYQVIARTRWKMDYKERWVEEGEIGYSTEIWYYDEWLMISEQRTYFYLVEDKDGFYLSNEIYPTSPSLPKNHNHQISFFKGYRKKPIQEIGKARVQYFEGESSYRLTVGDQIGFANYNYSTKKVYQVEWRLRSKRISEIEFFEENEISNFNVLKAFEDNEAVKKIYDRQKKWRFILSAVATTMLLFFLTTIYSMVKKESTVFYFPYDVSKTSVVKDLSVISQKFTIEKPGLHKLQLKASFTNDNTSMYSIAYIHNEKQDPIRAVEGNFYYWTGVEDGERWTEKKLNKKQVVIIKEAGTYFVEIFVTSEYANPGVVTFELTRNILLTRYFLLGTLFLIGLSIFCYRRSIKL